MGGVYSENIFDFKGMEDNLLPGDCPAVSQTVSWILGWGTGLGLCSSCLAFCVRFFPSTIKGFIKKTRDILIYSFFLPPPLFLCVWFYLGMKEMYMWIVCFFCCSTCWNWWPARPLFPGWLWGGNAVRGFSTVKLVTYQEPACACGSHNQCWASGFGPWIFNTCSHQ